VLRSELDSPDTADLRQIKISICRRMDPGACCEKRHALIVA